MKCICAKMYNYKRIYKRSLMFFPYVFDLNTAQNDVWYCTMYIIRLGCLVLYTISPPPLPPPPPPYSPRNFDLLQVWR